MRILLVRPPVPRHTIGLKHIMVCEPLELEYVAAGCGRHEVRILDLILERGLERTLRAFRPDVVGTSGYITAVNEIIKVCRTAKRVLPGCRTIVGGVHAAVAPEDFADRSIDAIALVDGPSIMPAVLAAIAEGRPLADVPGLAIPDGERIARTAVRPYMPDPDSLPLPRRDLVAHLSSRYYYLFHRPVALVKTTWGCPYRCTFCVPWRVTGGVEYQRSPESIVDEIAGLAAEDVYIVDDLFLAHPARLARIAALLRGRGVEKRYLVYGRADFLARNEKIVAEWAALGLVAVIVGLESPTDSELSSMDKRTTVEDNRRAIAVLRRHGVDIYASLIPQPDYTPEDWNRLWRFVDENGLYYLNVSPFTPMPGTLDWARYETSVTVPRAAHALWDLSHPVMPTRMPIADYYRELRRLYVRTCLDPRRASRLPLRTRPPIWSAAYLRLWAGAMQVWWQLARAHRDHAPASLRRAMDRGPELPVASWPATGRDQR